MDVRPGSSYWNRERNHREGSAFGTFLITLLLVVAIGVFAYSGWRLFGYYMDYKQGSDEYSELNEAYVKSAPASSGQDGSVRRRFRAQDSATRAGFTAGETEQAACGSGQGAVIFRGDGAGGCDQSGESEVAAGSS